MGKISKLVIDRLRYVKVFANLHLSSELDIVGVDLDALRLEAQRSVFIDEASYFRAFLQIDEDIAIFYAAPDFRIFEGDFEDDVLFVGSFGLFVAFVVDTGKDQSEVPISKRMQDAYLLPYANREPDLEMVAIP